MSDPLTRLLRGAVCLTMYGWVGAFAQTSPNLRAPQATSSGFELPRASGTLTYALSLSEGLTLGYNGGSGTSATTNIAGHLGFLSPSEKQPFSLIYSGAYLASTSTQPSAFAHNLGLSQVFNFHRYNIVLSDTISYLPDNPVSGLTGVPGLGDQGLSPAQAGQSDGAQLLSQYSPRVTNTTSGSVGYQFTGITSAGGSGTYSIIRTTGSGGVETSTESAGFGVTHRLSPLTSVSGNYSFSRFTYLAYPLVYDSQGATIEYTRQWTRNLNTDLAIGPEYSTSTSVPSTLNYSLNASANYTLPRGGLGASVVRATNSGSGITLASRSTSANVTGSRRLGVYSAASVNLGISQNVTLPTLVSLPFTTTSLVAGAQASRSISKTLSAYVSYTLQHQVPGQNGLAVNALNGTSQTLGFGLTYAPRPYIIGK